MKKQQNIRVQANKSRRSHGGGRDGLIINNWSALEEYLRAQPSALSHLSCAPREEGRLKELLARYGATELAYQADDSMEVGLLASVIVSYCEEEELLEQAAQRSQDLIIACDHVTDTRNLGAIARTAAFFGLKSLLLPKDRQASITSATMGAAQGAFASIRPTLVTNLGRTLLSLKDCGYWVATADMQGTTIDRMPAQFDKLVLVLGSEDRGVSAQVRAKSDLVLSISSFGGNLESLNVSVAAGILIHNLKARSLESKNQVEG